MSQAQPEEYNGIYNQIQALVSSTNTTIKKRIRTSVKREVNSSRITSYNVCYTKLLRKLCYLSIKYDHFRIETCAKAHTLHLTSRNIALIPLIVLLP